MKNSREKFKQAFPDEHSLVVALHARDLKHALEWTKIAIDNGAHGVALVSHFVGPEYGAYIACVIKERYPYHKVIANIRQRETLNTFKIMKWSHIDGIRVDQAMIKWIDEIEGKENSAEEVLQRQQENWEEKLYFGGLDFKHQKHLTPEEYPFAVQQAKKYLDVITTSWPATGKSADVEKVRKIKELSGDHPVGLASGVTPENIHEYISNTEISIVATGISKNYYDLDPDKVRQLAKIIEWYNRKIDRKKFEAQTLEQYKMTSATELYNYLKQWEIINIGMRMEHNEMQKKLSNLYPSSFTLDGIEYASVEAFRMSIKYPATDPRHVEIRKLSGIKAKTAGGEAKLFKSIEYQGEHIRIGSPEHHALLKRALRAKLEQNPDILKALLDTWDKELAHIVFSRHEEKKVILHDSKTIPGEIFAQLYKELREEFRK